MSHPPVGGGGRSVPASRQPRPHPPQPPPPAEEEPGWYADPFGRHQVRWWDGSLWTDHVATKGQQAVDPPRPGAPVPTTATGSGRRAEQKVVRQVQKVGADTEARGGGTLLTEPVLVVNQKPKLVEVNTEYAVYDQHGHQITTIQQVGQGTGQKLLRAVTDLDTTFTQQFAFLDPGGNVQLAATKQGMSGQVVVQDPAGTELGQILLRRKFPRFWFQLESHGEPVGRLYFHRWRTRHLTIEDRAGAEVGRLHLSLNVGRDLFTNADNYVIEMHRPLPDPLRCLVVASALGYDLMVAQRR